MRRSQDPGTILLEPFFFTNLFWHIADIAAFQLNFPGLPQILDISKLACPGLADVGMKLATFGRTIKTKGISAKSGSWFLFSTRFAN